MCIAGATAILPALSADVRDIGWYFLPVVILTSTLVMVVALVNNNIQRRYPAFWLYPHTTPPNPHPPRPTSLVLPSSNSDVVLEETMDKAKVRSTISVVKSS